LRAQPGIPPRAAAPAEDCGTAVGNVYTRLSGLVAVPNTAPVNFQLPIPYQPYLHGYPVVFQAIAYQAQGCLDVSEALNLQLRR
jgi:hypothetical protein